VTGSMPFLRRSSGQSRDFAVLILSRSCIRRPRKTAAVPGGNDVSTIFAGRADAYHPALVSFRLYFRFSADRTGEPSSVAADRFRIPTAGPSKS
jgi:hypothetical protein